MYQPESYGIALFAHAPAGTGTLLAFMYAFFLLGLGAIAIAPVVHL